MLSDGASTSKGSPATSRCRRASPTAHRQQTTPSPSECGAALRPRSGPACGSRAPREPKPPTSPTRLDRTPHDTWSRDLAFEVIRTPNRVHDWLKRMIGYAVREYGRTE